MQRGHLRPWMGVAAIAALMLGCGRAPEILDPSPVPTDGTSPGVVSLPLRELGSGPMSGIAETVTESIRDEAAWQAFWRRHDSTTAAPAVDFATEMVAVVVLQRNTGGYRVRLDNAGDLGGQVTVTYTEIEPTRDEVVIQVLTQPWAFAALPRRDNPLTFVTR